MGQIRDYFYYIWAIILVPWAKKSLLCPILGPIWPNMWPNLTSLRSQETSLLCLLFWKHILKKWTWNKTKNWIKWPLGLQFLPVYITLWNCVPVVIIAHALFYLFLIALSPEQPITLIRLTALSGDIPPQTINPTIVSRRTSRRARLFLRSNNSWTYFMLVFIVR